MAGRKLQSATTVNREFAWVSSGYHKVNPTIDYCAANKPLASSQKHAPDKIPESIYSPAFITDKHLL
jgi:hypothetical protein